MIKYMIVFIFLIILVLSILSFSKETERYNKRMNRIDWQLMTISSAIYNIEPRRDVNELIKHLKKTSPPLILKVNKNMIEVRDSFNNTIYLNTEPLIISKKWNFSNRYVLYSAGKDNIRGTQDDYFWPTGYEWSDELVKKIKNTLYDNDIRDVQKAPE